MAAITVPVKNAGSDFMSFSKYGFDAIFPTSYDDDYNFHTANDTSDRINFTYLTKATKFLLAVIAELASTPIELQVMITTPSEGYFYVNNNPLFPLVFKGYHLLQLERITAYYKILGLRGTTVLLGTADLNVDVLPLLNNINYVYLCIDGGTRYYQLGDSTHYQWAIPGPYIPIGRHRVEIYAGDSSGNVASDAINVIIY
jgi:Peptidase family M28